MSNSVCVRVCVCACVCVCVRLACCSFTRTLWDFNTKCSDWRELQPSNYLKLLKDFSFFPSVSLSLFTYSDTNFSEIHSLCYFWIKQTDPVVCSSVPHSSSQQEKLPSVIQQITMLICPVHCVYVNSVQRTLKKRENTKIKSLKAYLVCLSCQELFPEWKHSLKNRVFTPDFMTLGVNTWLFSSRHQLTRFVYCL